MEISSSTSRFYITLESYAKEKFLVSLDIRKMKFSLVNYEGTLDSSKRLQKIFQIADFVRGKLLALLNFENIKYP